MNFAISTKWSTLKAGEDRTSTQLQFKSGVTCLRWEFYVLWPRQWPNQVSSLFSSLSFDWLAFSRVFGLLSGREVSSLRVPGCSQGLDLMFLAVNADHILAILHLSGDCEKCISVKKDYLCPDLETSFQSRTFPHLEQTQLERGSQWRTSPWGTTGFLEYKKIPHTKTQNHKCKYKHNVGQIIITLV